MSQLKNLAQQRAAFAYTKVKNIREQNASLDEKKRWDKEFKSHVKDVPMMIKTNGLAAAYAFVFSKQAKNKDYRQIADISKEWLADKRNLLTVSGNEHFFEMLNQLQPAQYRRVTREIMALFTWLKRYADGVIES